MLIASDVLAGVVGGVLHGPVVDVDTVRLCTDSRHIRPGDLFLALRGPRFDGNHYVRCARAAGAVGAIAESAEALAPDPDAGTAGPGGAPFFGVVAPDTMAALAALAAWVRDQAPGKAWIGLTGSNGKTTTREMIARLLRLRGPVHASGGNFNNRVGLPVTLCHTPADAWAAVLEMGTSLPGEIDLLARVARPEVGVVTMVGPAHLEGFGDEDGVAREKAALFAHLAGERPLAVYPAADPRAGMLRERMTGPRASFAVEPHGEIAQRTDLAAWDVRPTETGTEFTVEGVAFRTRLFGRHNVANALAALLVARHHGIGLAEAADALAEFHPVGGRLQPRKTDDLVVVDDTYNANPASLLAAAEVLMSLPAPRRVLVVGDMLELGPSSRERHRQLGRQLGRMGLDVILAVGRDSLALAEGADRAHARTLALHFTSVPQLVANLGQQLRRGDGVLVKGSRGMRMEQVVEALKTWKPE